MELAGFIVGILGIALSIVQYLDSARNKRTLRNWGASIVRQHRGASQTYLELADRVESVDREQWRSMHPEVLSTLRRSATDASNTAQEIVLFIETVAGHERKSATPTSAPRGNVQPSTSDADS